MRTRLHRIKNSKVEQVKGNAEPAPAEYPFHPLTEGIVIGILVFFAIFITTYFIYYHTLNAQKGEIREGLLRTGSVLASFIDGDTHKKFISRDQEQSPLYEQALLPFKKTLHADSTIAFVYTLVLKNDKVYFVLDPTPSSDKNKDGIDDKSHIMQPYTEASKGAVRALKEHIKIAENEPYQDRWGSFMSAYIPFYDSNKQFVGVVGIDIRADNYYKRLAPIQRATIRAMVTAFFISFLISSAVWFMRNFSKIINQSRHKIYKEYLHLKGKD